MFAEAICQYGRSYHLSAVIDEFGRACVASEREWMHSRAIDQECDRPVGARCVGGANDAAVVADLLRITVVAAQRPDGRGSFRAPVIDIGPKNGTIRQERPADELARMVPAVYPAFTAEAEST